MDNEKEYRKSVLRRECKQDIAVIAVIAVLALIIALLWLVGSLMPDPLHIILQILAFVFALPLAIALINSLMTIHRKKHWSLAMGTIAEVFLEDDDSTPTTTARIRYRTSDGREQTWEQTLSTYGDYEEGCEAKVEAMLEEDRKKYENRSVPVFYWPKRPDFCLVMMKDLIEDSMEDLTKEMK